MKTRTPSLLTLLVALGGLLLPACGKQPVPDESADGGPKAVPRQEDKKEDKKAEQGRRARSAANLRQIARALFDYAVERRHLLPAALCERKTGQPLLSWRVALLPYIGQESLYKQFHLDESWDSDHNKKLLDRMPPAYAAPGTEPGSAATTRYRGFIAAPDSPVRTAWAILPAKESPFGVWGGRFPDSVADGSSNTFAVVEAAEAVPWTRPGEMAYDPKKPLPRLGGLFADGFHAGLMDGAVLFFSSQIDEAILRAYVTANGREPVDVRGLMDRGLIRFPGQERESK